ncbi:GAF domain-containing hybrid sensor histidine kinase/response regulator, partial [Geminicoccus flavidas]|uniref:GAF domain-containing hybrid sensor histidine kinase/response regulator n=1 Tax=Geminicoccus flavidas TaxID=2506407 RepID=UPI00135B4AEA
MPAAPIPADENLRLDSLRACQILDTPADPRLDAITRLAARLYDVPIALVTLVDESRQWFKSAVGLPAGSQTPRTQSMCAYTLLDPDRSLLIPDTRVDPRTADNPAVTGAMNVRFYAGIPLRAEDGHVLGTLCIVDTRPRQLRPGELDDLVDLAASVTGILALYRSMATLRQSEVEARRLAVAAEEARREAEAAASSRSMFLATMSHEIRTPLTGVLGMVDLLAEEALTDRQAHYLRSIRTSGRHLLSVVNEILDYSRIEADGLVLEEVDFTLEELVEQLRSILGPQAADRGLRLDFDLPDGPLPVLRGDPTRLRQVLVNLIGNGLKFTSEGGVRLGVRLGPADEAGWRVTFMVADTGIGIPKERQADLFKPFSQAELSTSRHYGGTGLGLAICGRLIAAMRGQITLDSVPDKGSTFHVYVPLGAGAMRPAASAAREAVPGGRALDVLVAEDVAVNRDLLQTVLARHGHRVEFAENGAEAVGKLKERAFDVVLMDVQMPVMDGIEATRRIRASQAPASRVPILGLTANVMAEERQHCLAAGMDQVLSKPFVWPELLAALGGIGGSTQG